MLELIPDTDHEVTEETLHEISEQVTEFLPPVPQYLECTYTSGARGVRWNAFCNDDGEFLIFSRESKRRGDPYHELGIIHRPTDSDVLEEYYLVSLLGRSYEPLYRESQPALNIAPDGMHPLDKYPQLAGYNLDCILSEVDDGFTDPRSQQGNQETRINSLIDNFKTQDALCALFRDHQKLAHSFTEARANKLQYLLWGLDPIRDFLRLNPEKTVPTDTEKDILFMAAQELYALNPRKSNGWATFGNNDYGLTIKANDMCVSIKVLGDIQYEINVTKIGSAYNLTMVGDSELHYDPQLSWLESYAIELGPHSAQLFTQADLEELLRMMYENHPFRKI